MVGIISKLTDLKFKELYGFDDEFMRGLSKVVGMIPITCTFKESSFKVDYSNKESATIRFSSLDETDCVTLHYSKHDGWWIAINGTTIATSEDDYPQRKITDAFKKHMLSEEIFID